MGEVIDAVHAADVETAILTNTDAWHWHTQLVDEAEADRYPSVRRIGRHFPSHVVGVVKPERAVFDAVMAATGPHGAAASSTSTTALATSTPRWTRGGRGVLVDPSGDPARQMLFELNRRMVTLGQGAGCVAARSYEPSSLVGDSERSRLEGCLLRLPPRRGGRSRSSTRCTNVTRILQVLVVELADPAQSRFSCDR